MRLHSTLRVVSNIISPANALLINICYSTLAVGTEWLDEAYEKAVQSDVQSGSRPGSS
jgi:hypothetical protein